MTQPPPLAPPPVVVADRALVVRHLSRLWAPHLSSLSTDGKTDAILPAARQVALSFALDEAHNSTVSSAWSRSVGARIEYAMRQVLPGDPLRAAAWGAEIRCLFWSAVRRDEKHARGAYDLAHMEAWVAGLRVHAAKYGLAALEKFARFGLEFFFIERRNYQQDRDRRIETAFNDIVPELYCAANRRGIPPEEW